MTDNFSHCLRPLFTSELIQTLQKGSSINLIAQEGQGRHRLLKDIENSRLKNLKCLFVNMSSYKENYDGFLQTLWQQLSEKSEKPVDFAQLMIKLENNNNNTIIILHHFDELLDNVQIDKKFNIAFFKQLNDIINKDKISLLCVTAQAHDQCVVFINGKRHRISWLCLEKRRLPKLTYDEIQLDLRRRNLPLSQDELSQIAWTAHNHTKPYSLLSFFAAKVANKEEENIDISHRIKMWYEQFTEEEKSFFQEYNFQLYNF